MASQRDKLTIAASYLVDAAHKRPNPASKARRGHPSPAKARARTEKADRYLANVLPVIREIQDSGIKSLRGGTIRL